MVTTVLPFPSWFVCGQRRNTTIFVVSTAPAFPAPSRCWSRSTSWSCRSLVLITCQHPSWRRHACPRLSCMWHMNKWWRWGSAPLFVFLVILWSLWSDKFWDENCACLFETVVLDHFKISRIELYHNIMCIIVRLGWITCVIHLHSSAIITSLLVSVLREMGIDGYIIICYFFAFISVKSNPFHTQTT